MASLKPWVKNSLEFSRFFSLLHQFIESEKKTRWYITFQSKYKPSRCENVVYDRYDSMNRTETYAK